MRTSILKRGTPKEIADHATGYSGNGSSIYSRHSAAGVTIPGFKERRTVDQLIAKNERQLEDLKFELTHECYADFRQKLRINIAIKEKFLDRLRKEKEATS
jgi:hypothetical protein